MSLNKASKSSTNNNRSSLYSKKNCSRPTTSSVSFSSRGAPDITSMKVTFRFYPTPSLRCSISEFRTIVTTAKSCGSSADITRLGTGTQVRTGPSNANGRRETFGSLNSTLEPLATLDRSNSSSSSRPATNWSGGKLARTTYSLQIHRPDKSSTPICPCGWISLPSSHGIDDRFIQTR